MMNIAQMIKDLWSKKRNKLKNGKSLRVQVWDKFLGFVPYLTTIGWLSFDEQLSGGWFVTLLNEKDIHDMFSLIPSYSAWYDANGNRENATIYDFDVWDPCEENDALAYKKVEDAIRIAHSRL